MNSFVFFGIESIILLTVSAAPVFVITLLFFCNDTTYLIIIKFQRPIKWSWYWVLTKSVSTIYNQIPHHFKFRNEQQIEYHFISTRGAPYERKIENIFHSVKIMSIKLLLEWSFEEEKKVAHSWCYFRDSQWNCNESCFLECLWECINSKCIGDNWTNKKLFVYS